MSDIKTVGPFRVRRVPTKFLLGATHRRFGNRVLKGHSWLKEGIGHYLLTFKFMEVPTLRGPFFYKQFPEASLWQHLRLAWLLWWARNVPTETLL